MQWHTQAGVITTNLKVKCFMLPELSTTKIMTWDCHVDDYTKGRYEIRLVTDLLTALELNIKLSDHVIK